MTIPQPPPDSPEIPSELLEELPPRVVEILEFYGFLLSQKGVLDCRTERRRKPSYRLRFRQRKGDGTTSHRSVSLGHDPDVARRVDRILTHWREQRAEARRRRMLDLQDRRRQRAERRRLQNLVVVATGGGRRHRRPIRQYVGDLVGSNDGVAGIRLLSLVEQGFTSPASRGRARRGKQLW